MIVNYPSIRSTKVHTIDEPSKLPAARKSGKSLPGFTLCRAVQPTKDFHESEKLFNAAIRLTHPYHTFLGSTVDLIHDRDLRCLFRLRGLIEAECIDPERSDRSASTEIPESGLKLTTKGKVMPSVDSNALIMFAITPAVRQGLIFIFVRAVDHVAAQRRVEVDSRMELQKTELAWSKWPVGVEMQRFGARSQHDHFEPQDIGFACLHNLSKMASRSDDYFTRLVIPCSWSP